MFEGATAYPGPNVLSAGVQELTPSAPASSTAATISYGASGAHETEVNTWATAVSAAGSEVYEATLDAADEFVAGLKSDGLWTLMQRVNLFAGKDLTACLIPLVATIGTSTDSNRDNAFVSGDYVERGSTGGLKGDGSTKELNTGVTMNSTLWNNCMVGVYGADYETTADSIMLMGYRDPGTGTTPASKRMQIVVGQPNGGPNRVFAVTDTAGVIQRVTYVSQATSGLAVAVIRGGTSISLNWDGVNAGTTVGLYGSQQPTDATVCFFGSGESTTSPKSAARIKTYFIGAQTTVANIAQILVRIRAFNARLDRDITSPNNSTGGVTTAYSSISPVWRVSPTEMDNKRPGTRTIPAGVRTVYATLDTDKEDPVAVWKVKASVYKRATDGTLTLIFTAESPAGTLIAASNFTITSSSLPEVALSRGETIQIAYEVLGRGSVSGRNVYFKLGPTSGVAETPRIVFPGSVVTNNSRYGIVLSGGDYQHIQIPS